MSNVRPDGYCKDCRVEPAPVKPDGTPASVVAAALTESGWEPVRFDDDRLIVAVPDAGDGDDSSLEAIQEIVSECGWTR